MSRVGRPSPSPTTVGGLTAFFSFPLSHLPERLSVLSCWPPGWHLGGIKRDGISQRESPESHGLCQSLLCCQDKKPWLQAVEKGRVNFDLWFQRERVYHGGEGLGTGSRSRKLADRIVIHTQEAEEMNRKQGADIILQTSPPVRHFLQQGCTS